MKKLFLTLLLSVACLTATACTPNKSSSTPRQATAPTVENVQGEESVPPHRRHDSLTVTGCGKIQVKPDIATVYVGVETMIDGEDIAAGQSQNSETIKRVLAEIRSSGVAESEIATQDISVYKRYDYSSERLIGYRITQMIEFKTKQLGTLDQLVEKLLTAGANQLNGICFSLEDPSAHYNEALQAALADANEKAAAILGAQELKTLRICEQSYCCIPYRSNSISARRASTLEATAPGGESSAIACGQLTVEASLKVVYDLP